MRPPPKPDLDESVRKQALMAMLSAGETLRARRDFDDDDDDDDPDVRMWAARQFGDIDPEAAAAAIHSIFALLPTQDVLDLRQWARDPPPSRPTLREMADDALLARFEDAAERENATQFLDPLDNREDQEAKDRLADEMLDILRELKARGLLGGLEPLLESANLTVRFRAAQGCLRLDEKRAVTALESVIAMEVSTRRSLRARRWTTGAKGGVSSADYSIKGGRGAGRPAYSR